MKRSPSRMMPPHQSAEFGWKDILVCLAICGPVLAVLACSSPTDRVAFLVITAAFAAVGIVANEIHRDRLGQIADDRSGESICTFARSFHCRSIDTWVIRAVFEELQVYCRFGP